MPNLLQECYYYIRHPSSPYQDTVAQVCACVVAARSDYETLFVLISNIRMRASSLNTNEFIAVARM